MSLNNASNLKYYDSGNPLFNLSVGSSAGNVSATGGQNVTFGTNAGSSLTLGMNNTGFGYNVLKLVNTGQFNTCLGSLAGSSITNGTNNCAFGHQALLSEQSGNFNCAFGTNSLATQSAAIGSGDKNNVAMGYASGFSMTTGYDNTIFGFQANYSETTGAFNCSFGYSALQNANGSNGNCAFGYQAADSQFSYTNCVFIGAGADSTANNITNSIAIGFQATLATSNTIVIGNSSHGNCTINGIFGTTVTNNPVYISNTGVLGTIVSSERFKQNISDMGERSSQVWKLRPVNFTFIEDISNTLQFGLIAEEVAKVFPEIVNLDTEGKPHSVRYHDLPVILLNELKKLLVRFEAQDQEIQNLKSQLLSQEIYNVSPQ